MKVVSIFTSLDGEVTHGGPLQWATFVRLAGCNLRCYADQGHCDAPHALLADRPEHQELSVGEVVNDVIRRGPSRVTITGGEPLLQKEEVLQLGTRLTSRHHSVTLETNGSIALEPILEELKDAFDCIVMDLKCPSTGSSDNMVLDNLGYLRRGDYVKAVIKDDEDLVWLQERLNEVPHCLAKIAIGPMMDGPDAVGLDAQELVDWMSRRYRFSWRLNLQLHKIIWPMTAARCSGGYTDLNEVDYARYRELEI